MKRRTRRTALVGMGLVFTVAFGYLAVRDVHFHDFWSALRSSNYWWLLPALLALAGGVFLRALRWRFLFAVETRPPVRDVTDALLIGYLYNNILPARAGELFRIVALKQLAGTSRAETAATVVVERVYDVLCLLVLLFVTLPWLPHVSWLRAAGVLALVLAAGLVAAVGVLARFAERPLRLALKPLSLLPFVTTQAAARAADNLTRGLASLRRIRLGLGALFWTTVSWLLLAISFWCVIRATHLGLSPVAGILVAVATGLSMIVPASPAALGVFEAAAIAAVTPYGISRSHALSYAVVLHALNFFPYLVAGLLVIRLRAAKLGRARKSAALEPSLGSE